ncbi:hypothetical protein NXW70_21275 [Bacteroides fragilis]|nr:hypothetical protein [Bacteroides fragilis]
MMNPSPYSFVAKEEKEGKKVIGWTLFPVFFEDREDPALQEQARMAKVTARLQLENNVYDYLKFSFDFKSDEVNKNKKPLSRGQKPASPISWGSPGELKKGAWRRNPKRKPLSGAKPRFHNFMGFRRGERPLWQKTPKDMLSGLSKEN